MQKRRHMNVTTQTTGEPTATVSMSIDQTPTPPVAATSEHQNEPPPPPVVPVASTSSQPLPVMPKRRKPAPTASSPPKKQKTVNEKEAVVEAEQEANSVGGDMPSIGVATSKKSQKSQNHYCNKCEKMSAEWD